MSGALEQERLLASGQTYTSLSERIAAINLRPPGRLWLLAFAASLLLTLAFAAGVGELLEQGVGIWGINIPVAWAFALIN